MKTGETEETATRVVKTPRVYICKRWLDALPQRKCANMQVAHDSSAEVIWQLCIDLLEILAEAVNECAQSRGVEKSKGCSKSCMKHDC